MVKVIEQRFWQYLEVAFPRLYGTLFTRRRVIKYILAGGTAACVDLSVLYVAHDVAGISLLPSVAIAFFFGFLASFLLQKFWAFEDRSVERVHSQASLYFAVSGVNFFLNLLLMYLLVEVFGLWYLFAKIVVSGGIACSSFFVYKIFIFKDTTHPQ